MKTNTKQQLFEYIEKNEIAGPTQLASYLEISTQMVHRHLKALLSEGLIRKSGVPPKVVYRLDR